MFYYFLTALVQPYSVLLFGLLAGLVVGWRWEAQRRRGQRLALACLLLLWLISTPLVSYWAVWSLEGFYPPLQGFPEEAQAIVVLTGGLRVYDEKGDRWELGADTAFRAMHGAELYHRAGHRAVVASGGRLFPEVPGPTLAQGAGTLLRQLGVAPDDLILEEQSRTTYENALCCREVLKPRGVRRIVLVTDATHMLRAARTFRAAGFEVVPAACNYRAGLWKLTLGDFLPSADAAANIGTTCHEWLGLLWYWLHGRL